MTSKAFTFTIFTLLSFNIVTAQKLYIWCPEPRDIKQHVGFLKNQDVNIVLFDGRNIPKNSKIKCDQLSLEQDLAAFLKSSYLSAKIEVLADSMYYNPSEKNKITIKIGIAAYQAGFGIDVNIGIGSVGGKFAYSVFPQGKWNGLVSYYVQIFDNRGDTNKKVSKEISEITSKANLLGYTTARSCLFASYDNANQELLSFIEDSLML